MSEGPLDNYLTAEEEAYFKSGGSEATEAKIEAEHDTESNDNQRDVSNESEHDDSRAEQTTDASDESDSASDAEDESDSDDDSDTNTPKTQSDRDFEKAFKTERHKRKELREALEAQARKTAEMEAALNEMRQNMQRQEQTKQEAARPREAIPDADEDPLAYQQYQLKQLGQALTEQQKYLNAREQAEVAQKQQEAFVNYYKSSAQQFAQKQTDFGEAYNFLTDARIKEHMAAGYSNQEAQSLIIEEEMAIVAKALQDKVNPAERIYNVARNRGYNGKDSVKKAVPATKNISDIKRGMDNAKSLKSGGGHLNEGELGIDDIDSMDFAQFDDFWAGFKAKSKQMG